MIVVDGEKIEMQNPYEYISRKHFYRPFKDTRRWNNSVHQPADKDLNLFGQLYSDCFTHHNGVRFAPADQDKFHFQKDPRRLVRKDNLSSYFQRRFIDGSIPEYKSASIYQSPNSVEMESELGSPCGFNYFYDCVTAIPFDCLDQHNPTLGENRVTFLIGNVGIGKTFTVSQVVQKVAEQDKDDSGYKLIPVYVCLENFNATHGDTNDSPEFVRRFLIHLFDVIKKSVLQYCPSIFVELPKYDSSKDFNTEQISFQISELIKFLARISSVRIRVVLFLDNLDVLHYQNSRYIFFPSEYTKHRRLIEDKIVKFIFAFVDPNVLGDSGLCVLISARQNVARESRLVNQSALPRRAELNDHLVFQLGGVDALDIIKSRLHMFEQVIKEYSISKGNKVNSELSFSDQLSLLRVSTGKSVCPTNLNDGLRRISDLSHHGARSLVDFLGRLRLNLVQQSDAVDRLFSHSPWLLERLYISNVHQRFSQAQGHFPNIFLIDGTISEPLMKDVNHRHTYWLKYLLLRRIGFASVSGIYVQDLLDEFVREFGFEDKIVRLALGSLAMVNESRCIEIGGVAQDECHENIVRLTSRGQLLAGFHSNYKMQYCFELSYIQMVIDDHLLSLPKPFALNIAVDTSINYAFDASDDYYYKMRSDLNKKIPAAIYFTRVLEAAWNWECKMRPKLAASLNSIGPSFDAIYENLNSTVLKVAAQASFNPSTSIQLINKLRADSTFDDFFVEYGSDFDKIRKDL